MTLPVRIEAKAWTDSRYATVALYLGLSAGDAEIALIRCAAIWRWQTEHYTEAAPTYVVPEGVVIGALKSLDGPRALVVAGLAELAEGGLRIKGGRNDKGESRIDWYWRDQQQRSAAGKASEARRGAGGRFGAKAATSPDATDGQPTHDRRSTDGPPADDQRKTDSLISGLRTPDPETHTPRAREGQPELVTDATVGRDQDVPGKPDEQGRPVDRVLVLAERFRSEVDTARRALLVELGAPFPPSRTTDASVLSMAMAVVAGWCASEPDQDPEAIVAARSAHLLANRLAVARDRRRADWWAPSTFWDPDGIGKDLEHRTPADAVAASRARAGPRDGQPRRPPQPDPPRTPVNRL